MKNICSCHPQATNIFRKFFTCKVLRSKTFLVLEVPSLSLRCPGLFFSSENNKSFRWQMNIWSFQFWISMHTLNIQLLRSTGDILIGPVFSEDFVILIPENTNALHSWNCLKEVLIIQVEVLRWCGNPNGFGLTILPSDWKMIENSVRNKTQPKEASKIFMVGVWTRKSNCCLFWNNFLHKQDLKIQTL